MDSKGMKKAEKELFKISELDRKIKCLQNKLNEENKRYEIFAYQIQPPADNRKGYSSVREKSDPTSNAAQQLEEDKFKNYVDYIKADIKTKNDERIEILRKLDRLCLTGKVEDYAYYRYVEGKPRKEAASLIDVSPSCASVYRTRILEAYVSKHNL